MASSATSRTIPSGPSRNDVPPDHSDHGAQFRMTQRTSMLNRRDLIAGSAALGASLALPPASGAQDSTPEAPTPSSGGPRLPEGYALVTSIRLPLAEIGRASCRESG